MSQRLPELIEKINKKSGKELVRLKTLEERQGLMRARNYGAQFARGKTLTFLDSHIDKVLNILIKNFLVKLSKLAVDHRTFLRMQ